MNMSYAKMAQFYIRKFPCLETTVQKLVMVFRRFNSFSSKFSSSIPVTYLLHFFCFWQQLSYHGNTGGVRLVVKDDTLDKKANKGNNSKCNRTNLMHERAAEPRKVVEIVAKDSFFGCMLGSSCLKQEWI